MSHWQNIKMFGVCVVDLFYFIIVLPLKFIIWLHMIGNKMARQ